MIGIGTSILAGLAFGLVLGIFFAARHNTHYSLIAGLIAGLAFGTALYFIGKSKIIQKQTQIKNPDDQSVVYSGAANHFVNGEAVGGKLYLQKTGIQFQSHSFNIQNHEGKIDIDQINEVSYFNSLGIIPNGIAITTIDGKTEKFVVNNRRIWKEKIEGLTAGNK